MYTPKCFARLFAVAVLVAPLPLLRAANDESLKELGVVTMVTPEFPDMARYDGLAEGHVTLAFRRTPSGEPQDILVLESSHPRMASAAVAAMRAWRFQPTREPADLEVRTVRISFRLRGVVVFPYGKDVMQVTESGGHGLVAPKPVKVPRMQSMTQRPKALNQPMPDYPSALVAKRLEGRAAVRFFVDEDGKVRLPEIIETTAPEFGAAALAAVAQWRYEPPKAGTRRIVAEDHWQFLFKPNN